MKGTSGSQLVTGVTSAAPGSISHARHVSAFESSSTTPWDDDDDALPAAVAEQQSPTHENHLRQPLNTAASSILPVSDFTGLPVQRSHSVTLPSEFQRDAAIEQGRTQALQQGNGKSGKAAGGSVLTQRSWGLFNFKRKGSVTPKRLSDSGEGQAAVDVGSSQYGEEGGAQLPRNSGASDGAGSAATAAAPPGSQVSRSNWGSHRPSSAPASIKSSTGQLASVAAANEGGKVARGEAPVSGHLQQATAKKPTAGGKPEGPASGSGRFAGLFTSRAGGSRPASAKSAKVGDLDGGVSTSSHSSMDGGVQEKASSSEGGASRDFAPYAGQNADSSSASQRVPLMSAVDSSGSSQVEPLEKVNGHRRGRSLSSIIRPRLKSHRPSATTDDFSDFTDGAPAAPPLSYAGGTVEQLSDAKSRLGEPRRNSSMGCFGGGKPMDGDEKCEFVKLEPASERLLPLGLVGLRNHGNTCFVNAAVQCLRYTPGLPLMLIPDLLDPQPLDSAPSLQPAPSAGVIQAADESSGSRRSSGGPAVSVTVSYPARPASSNGRSQTFDPPAVLSGDPFTALDQRSTPQTSPVNGDYVDIIAARVAAEQRGASMGPLQSGAVAVQAARGVVRQEDQNNTPPQQQIQLPVPSNSTVSAQQKPLSRGSPPGLPVSGHPAARAASDGSSPARVPVSAELASLRISVSATAAPHAPDRTSGERFACCEGPSTQHPDSSTANGTPHAAVNGGGKGGSSGAAEQPQSSAAVVTDQAGLPQDGPTGKVPGPAVRTAAVKPAVPPLVKGEMLQAFTQLVRELYQSKQGYVDPVNLLKRLAALDAGEEFINGGQHDCEELLSAVMDRLHEDLNVGEEIEGDAAGRKSTSSTPSEIVELQSIAEFSTASSEAPFDTAAVINSLSGRPVQTLFREVSSFSRDGDYEVTDDDEGNAAADASGDCGESQQTEESKEPELDKAERLWDSNLEKEDSPVTELFAGQLQGNIVCHKCKSRFTKYEVFRGLSLPLVKEAKAGISSWFSNNSKPASIQDCLAAFTADEVLTGDEDVYYDCEKCKEHTAATLYMRIQRFPRVLQLHIKRFKYAGLTREKLVANVSFPLKGLKLSAYASDECNGNDGAVEYDLYGIINHYGSLSAGHYTASCRVAVSQSKEDWYSFNDENVYRLPSQGIVTPNAYILFYIRRE